MAGGNRAGGGAVDKHRKRRMRNKVGVADGIFKNGMILKDMRNNEYVLGEQFSKGGFGLLYTGREGRLGIGREVAVKLEPKKNGPLFCEIHFYSNLMAKLDEIQSFMIRHNLVHLAVPRHLGIGMLQVDDIKDEYRFLVLPLYGNNAEDVMNECRSSSSSPLQNALLSIQIMHQVFFALFYLHEHGYVHADVKDTNIVFDKHDPRKVFLIDYGLAVKYIFSDGKHQQYQIKPKNKHEGTLEYTSEDRHRGVCTSRRSDLEVFCYALLDQLTQPFGLPWKKTKSADQVMKQKIQLKLNVVEYLNMALANSCIVLNSESNSSAKSKCTSAIKTLTKLLDRFCECIFSIEYEQRPDYDHLNGLLVQMADCCRGKMKKFNGLIDDECVQLLINKIPSRAHDTGVNHKRRLESSNSFENDTTIIKTRRKSEIAATRLWSRTASKGNFEKKDAQVQTIEFSKRRI